jgi:predicted amidohydrolase
MQDLRVSLVQGDTAWHDPEANRRKYGALMAPLSGATDLILLPETFTSGFSNEAIHRAEGMDGPTVAWIREQAARLGAVVCGSVQIRDQRADGSEGVFNRLLWATPEGALRQYDKRHLFRMAGEHERYAGGSERLVVEIGGWRVCPLVCYDLRFPVWSRNRYDRAAQRFDYDLLLYVANWPSARRQPWRTLLLARAIEYWCYCAGVNRVGTDGNDLHYAGDSAVADFTGQTLVELGAQEQVVTVVLDAAALAAHRARFPAWMDADDFSLMT